MAEIHLILAEPTESDARQMMQFRNDADTLAFSIHQNRKEWPEYFDEYIDSLRTAYPTFFITEEGERVGYISLRPYSEDSPEVSVMVSPAHRGKGIAKRALTLLLSLERLKPSRQLVARIRPENKISLSLFESVGFLLKERDEFLTLILSLRKIEPLFIIAEAGSNWVDKDPKSSLHHAYKMIEVAKEAGADAVKFQTFRAETTYAKAAGNYHGEDIELLFKKLELPYNLLGTLADFAKQWDIEFMSSIFSKEDFLAVNPLVERHKIASYEISHPELIDLVAESKKPLILSTGASDLEDVEWAVKRFKKSGGEELTLMQCTAAYPAPLSQMNLATIRLLLERFALPVGLSDHSREIFTAPLVALGFGARVIEKHFTLSREDKGPDHAFSLEPNELKRLCTLLREGEAAIGTGRKELLPVEEELFRFAKRSLQTTRSVEKGEALLLGESIAVLRPGNQPKGSHPRDIKLIEGHFAKRPLIAGEGVTPDDVE